MRPSLSASTINHRNPEKITAMKKLYTAKDIETLIRSGEDPSLIPEDAMLTPSAKDVLRQTRNRPGGAGSAGVNRVSARPGPSGSPADPDNEFKWEPGRDPGTSREIERFFNSQAIETIKRRMVDIGDRLWKRGYVDGNGGNLTVRVGDNLFLCTPTLVSKGYMTTEDIGLIDFEGKQLAGSRKRSSEALTHLAIYKRQPKARSCCHAHPVHATAFAVAGVRPPTCHIPEAEVFLGPIGLAEYQTPGTPANAEVVGEAALDHNSILMVNHGVITWGKDIEDAYWKMENTDAYCQTLWVASFLKGGELKSISGSQARELIELRKSLGMDDPREELKECELCDSGDFRPGVMCPLPDDLSRTSRDSDAADYNPEAEAVVKAVTDQIMETLKKNTN